MRLRGQDRGAPGSPHEGNAGVHPRPPPEPLHCGFEALREQGYKLVVEVASELGVSATTLRRMEEASMIPKARRVKATSGKLVRAYAAEALNLIASTKPRERWLAKHPGRWKVRY